MRSSASSLTKRRMLFEILGPHNSSQHGRTPCRIALSGHSQNERAVAFGEAGLVDFAMVKAVSRVNTSQLGMLVTTAVLPTKYRNILRSRVKIGRRKPGRVSRFNNLSLKEFAGRHCEIQSKALKEIVNDRQKLETPCGQPIRRLSKRKDYYRVCRLHMICPWN